MAEINIFDIQPHKVSRDLSGYTVFFYGEPKSGKTTAASKFEKNLLIATETGYKALPGVKAQDVNSWTEFKSILRQLKDEKAKELYHSITIDTVDLLWTLCEKFVCSNGGKDSIADFPYGKQLCRSKKVVKTGKLNLYK